MAWRIFCRVNFTVVEEARSRRAGRWGRVTGMARTVWRSKPCGWPWIRCHARHRRDRRRRTRRGADAVHRRKVGRNQADDIEVTLRLIHRRHEPVPTAPPARLQSWPPQPRRILHAPDC